ncbi:polyhydroxyalkanoate depolymerase [Pelistega europaea]|uniref:Polyhydroxyalkanoate depolymerase n=1 Tax=Pelistega europaea TaxID=106147 RepID=A0A7Y4P3N9_9BURK|nr:polyhydroxyalkanoate depolymerase [Pelistega europaea]NOL49212.1 polyhydroxyalkanoate depolymerase [Pelistega europaea]
MLYLLHELAKQSMAPFVSFSTWGAKVFSDPFSPYAYIPNSRHIAAGFELLHRLGKDYEKPAWNITEADVGGKTATITETLVEERAFCRLIHFERSHSKHPKGDPIVLIVAPLSGHHATLLRDTVQTMLQSFDVYVTDWIDARMVPLSKGAFHLDDYVQYIIDFIHLLGPNTHVMSVCQPTVPVLAAVSLMASNNDPIQVKSMIMMGGPLDTRLSPTSVNGLANQKSFTWFETQLIHRVPPRYPGHNRRVYPGFLQHAGFVAMNPDKHAQSHYDYYLNLMRGNDMEAETHRKFYDEYNAVLDLPAEYYLDTIKVVFQEHLLPRGLWKVKGQLVEPAAITKAHLLTVEGELDNITGKGQTQVAHQMCSNIPEAHKQHYEVEKAGHYGIFSGRRWRTKVFPVIEEFINQAEKEA